MVEVTCRFEDKEETYKGDTALLYVVDGENAMLRLSGDVSGKELYYMFSDLTVNCKNDKLREVATDVLCTVFVECVLEHTNGLRKPAADAPQIEREAWNAAVKMLSERMFGKEEGSHACH